MTLAITVLRGLLHLTQKMVSWEISVSLAIIAHKVLQLSSNANLEHMRQDMALKNAKSALKAIIAKTMVLRCHQSASQDTVKQDPPFPNFAPKVTSVTPPTRRCVPKKIVSPALKENIAMMVSLRETVQQVTSVTLEPLHRMISTRSAQGVTIVMLVPTFQRDVTKVFTP